MQAGKVEPNAPILLYCSDNAEEQGTDHLPFHESSVAALQVEKVEAASVLVILACTHQTENKLSISNLWTLSNNPSAHS